MNKYFKSFILHSTKAKSIGETSLIQNLWSGYGKILRIQLIGGPISSVVVKHVQFPTSHDHPRGWNSDMGHQRKLKSYQIEMEWYKSYSKNCLARVPDCIGLTSHSEEVLIVLEDLDKSGFPVRRRAISWNEITACLAWLAKFHASFLGQTPSGLWEIGTYWHLNTRPDELAVLSDERLKKAAGKIDQMLNSCKYQTFVHGDAKLANFCFGENGHVAGVDFQYVGGGCGMKDVAYFVGSCLSEDDCERLESKILDNYFDFLQSALGQSNTALENEWRSYYRVAWADFHRFLKGWSPGHWKINSYSERVTQEVINNL